MSETFSQMFLFNFQSFQWAKVKQWRSSTRFHLFVNKSWINSCSRVWHRSAICRLHVSWKNTLSLINKSSRVSQFVYFDFFPGKTVGPILKSIDLFAIIYPKPILCKYCCVAERSSGLVRTLAIEGWIFSCATAISSWLRWSL